MRRRGGLQGVTNRWLLYWPPPDDDDFRRLSGRVTDISVDGLLAFYNEWLPDAANVPEASVRLQESDVTYTEGRCVWLNVAQSRPFNTATERLASVHATMWHEAGHVRHPTYRAWLDGLAQRADDVGADRVLEAFQVLEDLRVERELVNVRPQAAAWLRYTLGFRKGMRPWAVWLGQQSDCGWAMAATITAGRAVAGVIDRDALTRIRKADKRLATETNRLWDLWSSYSLLTDDELNHGAGDEQLLTLARLLPEDTQAA